MSGNDDNSQDCLLHTSPDERDGPSITFEPQLRHAASYGTLRPRDGPPEDHPLRHRRSSIRDRLHNLGDIGGPNSLNNFARSWSRAAAFAEVAPARRSFVLESDLDAAGADAGPTLRPRPSFLRAFATGQDNDSVAVDDDVDNDTEIFGSVRPSSRRSSPRADSIFTLEPQIGSPFGGSYRSSSSTRTPRITEASILRSAELPTASISSCVEPDQKEPLIVRRIEPEDGKHIDIVVGNSTVPQTVFNSINTLIGVGMLSLPLAFRFSGWIIGVLFFAWSAIVTSYTARLLAKCLDVDGTLITFADLALVSFGNRARLATSILFLLELLAACVALVILFADSLNALDPAFSITTYKITCGVILIPLGFVPLKYLSLTSILGILCCLGITLAVLTDGLIKPSALGSLRDPATTYLLPANWKTLPLAFGLLMAPWGGHSVFPNIYRDMRHPKKYGKAVNVTYIFTFILEAALAVAGYLMYGDSVRDEITANIFLTDGYPRWISIFIVIAIAIIPLTKIPLNARPIVSTFEVFCGIHGRTLPAAESMTGMTALSRGMLSVGIRVGTNILIVALAILIPSFDRIMSLLGSLACFTICIILPCSFHLKIFGRDLSLKHKILDWSLIIFSTILATAGTVAAFIPKHLLGVPPRD